MSERRPLLSRRHFLAALGAGGAATVAAVAARGNTTNEQPQAATAPDGHGSRGYRESEHVARYYRSTRI